MGPTLDFTVSALLCGEDNSSIFCDEIDCGAVEELFYPTSPLKNRGTINQNPNFNGEDSFSFPGLPKQSDECLASLIKRECEHLPNRDYLSRFRNGELDLEARKEAVDWIGKVHARFNFGPLCAYLSVNYLDRFLSAYELPKDTTWTMQLLAVACLCLAAKIEETKIPLCLDLQVGESKFVFEAGSIHKMELLILSTLKWRMQAVTPFSFVDYFLRKINGDDKISLRSLTFRSTQIILSILQGIDFLGFRPSEVAAAVTVSVARETKTVDSTEEAISLLIQHVEKERVMKCVELLIKSSLINGSLRGTNWSAPYVPKSPIGVLDAACLSYEIDDTAVGSCTNSAHDSPDTNKRRKLNRSCGVKI